MRAPRVSYRLADCLSSTFAQIHRADLGFLAVHFGFITEEQLREIGAGGDRREAGDSPRGDVGRHLVARGLITDAQLAFLSEEQKRRRREQDLAGAGAIPNSVLEARADPNRLRGDVVLVELLSSPPDPALWRAWDRNQGRWVTTRQDGRPPSALHRIREWNSRHNGAGVVACAALVALALGSGIFVLRGGSERDDARRAAEVRESYEPFFLKIKLLRLWSYRSDFRLGPGELAQFREVIRGVRERMDRSGPHAQGWYLIGRCLELTGDAEGAIDSYGKGLQLDGTHAGCLAHKARLLVERRLVELSLSRRGTGRTTASFAVSGDLDEMRSLLRRTVSRGGSGVPEIELDITEAYIELFESAAESARGRASPRRAALVDRCTQLLDKWDREPFREEFLLVRGLARPERLVEETREAIRLRPGFAKAFLWRGIGRGYRARVMAEAGQDVMAAAEWEGAVADFTTVVEIDPRTAEAYLGRAMVYVATKRYRRALEDISRALEINPRLAAAHEIRGRVRSGTGDPEGALAEYARAIELDPLRTEAYRSRADVLMRQGHYEAAIKDYQKALTLNPRDVKAAVWWAKCRRLSGDRAGALEDLDRIIAESPPCEEAYFERGLVLHFLSEHRRAIRDFSRAIELDPREFRSYLNRAHCRLDEREYEAALEDCSRALALDPNSAEAHFKRGLALGHRADPRGAVESYSRTIALDPRHADAFANRGQQYRILAGKDPSRASRLRALAGMDLRRALECAPESWAARAWVEASLKQLVGTAAKPDR